MNIQKVIIQNFKTLRNFEITLNKELNIIVGDNEAGKSTLLEAINLVLTGQLNGRNINYEISPFLFSKSVVDDYLTKLKAGSNPALPTIKSLPKQAEGGSPVPELSPSSLRKLMRWLSPYVIFMRNDNL